MGLDVVSGGELAIAQAADFPLERVYLHGNNKSPAELEAAVAAGIGHIVIDNFNEIDLLDAITRRLGKRQAVLIRATPNVDPHTHHHISTGMADSKFGFPLSDGIALAAARRIVEKPGLDFAGVHCHIGSQLQETDPHRQAVAVALAFAAELRSDLGITIREFSPGGGIGIKYVRDAEQPPVAAFAEAITSAVREACDRHGLPLPRLVIEPGRSTVGRAGVALYTVGARKEIPGVRTYVSVDGGMADNIRPAIYGARYEALSAERPAAPPAETVTIAGKYCESGDILIRDIGLPRLNEGEVLAIPASGAYCLAMASNYNASLRPAVVFVRDGRARLVRRRETYADLLACDVD
jgi:diaminopimelate decarboxylase